MCSPSGSCCRIARNAVGAVKSVETPCSAIDAPEGARVGRADRLALVEDGRAAVEQRRVDDVGVADDPADVGGRPVDLARLDVVDVLHRPRRARRRGRRCRARSPSAGRSCPRCRGCRAGRSPRRRRTAPGSASATASCQSRSRAGIELGLELRALQDDAALRLRLDQLDRGVEQRLVGHERRRLDPARRGDDDLRPRVLDPARELVRGEPAEHDRVDRAEARAREHRDHRLGHHRHVDDHAVALLDALGRERAGEARDLVAQLAVGERRPRARDGRVVDQRELVGATALDVPVERVVAGVQPAAGEPAVERRARSRRGRAPTARPSRSPRRPRAQKPSGSSSERR